MKEQIKQHTTISIVKKAYNLHDAMLIPAQTDPLMLANIHMKGQWKRQLGTIKLAWGKQG